MIPYTTQREKIVQAYLKCEIEPWRSCACFVGNLLNNNHAWGFIRVSEGSYCSADVKIRPNKDAVGLSIGKRHLIKESQNMYSVENICKIEQVFLREVNKKYGNLTTDEDSLFAGMVAALEELRLIHVEMGDETAVKIELERRILA